MGRVRIRVVSVIDLEKLERCRSGYTIVSEFGFEENEWLHWAYEWWLEEVLGESIFVSRRFLNQTEVPPSLKKWDMARGKAKTMPGQKGETLK